MEQRIAIHDILTQREQFLVVGLTGRMGSGCSKVAELLATPFEKLNFPHPKPQPGMNSLTEDERSIRIIAEYAEEHWLKFEVIQASAVIATFILEDDSCFISDLGGGVTDKMDTHRAAFREKLAETLYKETIELCMDMGLLDRAERNNYIRIITDDSPDEVSKFTRISTNTYISIDERKIEENVKRILEEACGKLRGIIGDRDVDALQASLSMEAGGSPALFGNDGVCLKPETWRKVGNGITDMYRYGLQNNPHIHRRKYLECVDGLVELCALVRLIGRISRLTKGNAKPEDLVDGVWRLLQELDSAVGGSEDDDRAEKAGAAERAEDILQIDKFVFVKYITTWLGRCVRNYITEELNADTYSRLFQRYGQMIRYYGYIPSYASNAPDEHSPVDYERKTDTFAIPRKINQHIKVLRHPFNSAEHRPVRIAIDSIKNIFEAVYLRYRYSAFYLWAITTNSDIREKRLRDKHLTDIQVRKLEWNEYPDKGGDVIRRVKGVIEKSVEVKKKEDKATGVKNDEEKDNLSYDEIYNIIVKNASDSAVAEAEADFYLDRINVPIENDPERVKQHMAYMEEYEKFNQTRRKFFMDSTYAFYTQDIDSCVSNADVYLFNNGTSATDIENNRKLLEAAVRNVSLVMYPGLVRPTAVERCMQIALSAKVNSGCLSRQVGAVVTDSQYNILSIGWNDVPCGEVSCAYKNILDIKVGADAEAYSEYELHDPEFRKQLARYQLPPGGLRGLPFSYCFKNAHSDKKDPMRSRAMHGEEKALALCGREAEGGYLFTTSSPCEMCSKNAKNHKISKIYYIEAYPGISQAQYTNSGSKDNRAELILFSGAVGRAYTQMYTPLLPHKDILEYLGVKKA